jgi:hypothetical protein
MDDTSDSKSHDGGEIYSELSAIKTSLQQILRYLSDAQSSHEALTSRVSYLESLRDSQRSPRRGGGSGSWICPVCWKPFAHRESFKGHIRRLTESPTDHMHCSLDPERTEHVALLSHHRYGNGDFASRAASFAQQLYDTVKSNSNSTRSSQSSHSAVSNVYPVIYIAYYLLLLLFVVCCVCFIDASDYGLAGRRR